MLNIEREKFEDQQYQLNSTIQLNIPGNRLVQAVQPNAGHTKKKITRRRQQILKIMFFTVFLLVRWHTENQFPGYPQSGGKAIDGGGGGGKESMC